VAKETREMMPIARSPLNTNTGRETRYMEIDWTIIKIKCQQCLHFFRKEEIQAISKTHFDVINACPKCREAIESAKVQMDKFYRRVRV
jgi:Zn finger protein HypA/HybF involved in hydrogenase expression